MPQKPKINRYKIDLSEVVEMCEAYGIEQTSQDMLDRAIDIARNRTRMYFMPATWEAHFNADGSITVIRYHN